MSENSIDDAQMTKTLLNSIPSPINTFIADGGYDTRSVYSSVSTRTDTILIPPRRDARIWVHGNTKGIPHPRDVNPRIIRAVGKKRWKKKVNYHRRSLVETSMYRFKRILGDTLADRTLSHQQVEVALKCKILNTMTSLGMPTSFPSP